jgi:hypothetical protein
MIPQVLSKGQLGSMFAHRGLFEERHFEMATVGHARRSNDLPLQSARTKIPQACPAEIQAGR